MHRKPATFKSLKLYTSSYKEIYDKIWNVRVDLNFNTKLIDQDVNNMYKFDKYTLNVSNSPYSEEIYCKVTQRNISQIK